MGGIPQVESQSRVVHAVDPIGRENPRTLVLRTHAGVGLIGQYDRAVGLSPFERFYLGGVFLSGFVLDGREIINLRGFDDLSLTMPTKTPAHQSSPSMERNCVTH